MAGEDPMVHAPRGLIALWCLAFLGFLLIGGGWAVAAPYDGTPDEKEHIVRAAGVAAGQVIPKLTTERRGSGAIQVVPAGLDRANCWQFRKSRSAACATPPGSDRTPKRVVTGAGRYHPLYYALVGWPLTLWPGWSGVILARLISAGLAAAVLAGAFVDIVDCSRHRLMLAGLLVATTPMAAHLMGAVNPNGLEIAAGIGLFASGIPLLLGERPGHPTRLLRHAGISAVLLAVLRTSGPTWLAIALFVLLVPASRQRLGTLWRLRATRWWVAGVTTALITSSAWIIAMKASNLGDFHSGRHFSTTQGIQFIAEAWRGLLDQAVAVTAWLDTPMPAPVYLVWEFAAAGLILWAAAYGRRVDRWRLSALAIGAVGIPSLIQLRYLNTVGFITQGRYLLPVLIGLVLLSAFILEERGVDAARARSLTCLFVVLLLPIHLVCLIFTMARWQRGLPLSPDFLPLRHLNPLLGSWHPPLGSSTPVIAATAGVLLIGALTWTATSRSATPRWLWGSGAATLGCCPHRDRSPGQPTEQRRADREGNQRGP